MKLPYHYEINHGSVLVKVQACRWEIADGQVRRCAGVQVCRCTGAGAGAGVGADGDQAGVVAEQEMGQTCLRGPGSPAPTC